MRRRALLPSCCLVTCLASPRAHPGEEAPWVATPLTEPGRFTPGIEGPACDRTGDIYAVNLEREGTIGRVKPDGKTEVFITLPEKSTGNGIRFGRSGDMFIADYSAHNVLRVDMRTRK